MSGEINICHLLDGDDKGTTVFKLTQTFQELREAISKKLESRPFVLVTSDRDEINEKNFHKVQAGDTFLLLKNKNQSLDTQFSENVTFEPHYDVLVKSGQYEYYASRGCQPLPFAVAELIDNSLGATADNGKEGKKIDIRFYLDDDKPQNSVIAVIDNGSGMKSQDLVNWAKYKYSKFNRQNRDFSANSHKAKKNQTQDCPKFLNSQISYFGAGGKQAVFFMGSAVRMISKHKQSKEVHEFLLSAEQFKEKELNREKIFEGKIISRQPGDESHISESCSASEIQRHIIEEEKEKSASFTSVVVTNIQPNHVKYLKSDFNSLVTQLAHIYHYYLHGPRGNVDKSNESDTNDRRDSTRKRKDAADTASNLEIRVSHYNVTNKKSNKTNNITANLTKPILSINLRDVVNDNQTKFIRSSKSVFEFKADVGNGVVEGILRYHPFLYDEETYPTDSFNPDNDNNSQGDDGMEMDQLPGRGNRAIFECYWNGRLIPYTPVQSLDWCSKRSPTIPVECYSRFSGVLFTDTNFEVTQNKLTFQEALDKLLNDPKVIYTVLVGNQYRRGIDEHFKKWLDECHNNYDKEIKFLEFQELIRREEGVPKNKCYPWSVFNGVEFSNQIFKCGQKIKTIKTAPIMIGTITRFLVWGSFVNVKKNQNVFGTSGFFEMEREPASLYGEKKIYPLTKLDVSATKSTIDNLLSLDEEKLPDYISVAWPESNAVEDNSEIAAGTKIGPIQVFVKDKNDRIVQGLQGKGKTVGINLTVFKHDPGKDPRQVRNFVSQKSASWGHWFLAIDADVFSKDLGKYSITLQTVIGETMRETKMGTKEMPSATIHFTVVEGSASSFKIKLDTSRSQRVGIPFQIPIRLYDKFSNEISNSRVNFDVSLNFFEKKQAVESCFDGIFYKDGIMYLKNVIVKTKLPPSDKDKSLTMTVKITEISRKEETMKVPFKPGRPAKLNIVLPTDPLIIENGTLPRFGALLFDCSDNPVTHLVERDLEGSIQCKFTNTDEKGNATEDLPGVYFLEFVTGPDGKDCALKGTPSCIQLSGLQKGVKKEIIAEFWMKENYVVPHVFKKIFVLASCKPSVVKLFCSSEFDENLIVEITKDLEWTAGSVIRNIHFKIYDDFGNEMEKPNLTQSNVKVTWATPIEVGKSNLREYKLPHIRVPPSTEQCVYQQVTLICAEDANATKHSVLQFHFTLKPRPGVASQLKAILPACSKIPAGQALSYHIEVKVCDKHLNGVSGINEEACNKLKISCDSADIDETELVKELGAKEGTIIIKHLKFLDTTLGPRNITLEYDNLREMIVVESVPGYPRNLKWVLNTQWDSKTLFIPRNGSVDVTVQLFDDYDNKCTDSGLDAMLGFKNVMILNDPWVTVTNEEGNACFGVKSFDVTPELKPGPCPLNVCATKCYGIFPLACKIMVGSEEIRNQIRVHLLCDLTRASTFNIGYSGDLDITAGTEFPAIFVDMVSEDDETSVKTVTIDQLELVHTKDGKYPQKFKASSLVDGTYNFEDFDNPKEAGVYELKFYFNGLRHAESPLVSDILKVTVSPGKPCTFAPLNPPANTLYASNKADARSRIIIEKLKFVLMDEFMNIVSAEDDQYDGKLTVTILAKSENNAENNDSQIPLFQGNESSLTFNIANGTAMVPTVMLNEKTVGSDGFVYNLHFKPEIGTLNLEPFLLEFTFTNDTEKQLRLSLLDKKKEGLHKKMQDCDRRCYEKRKEVDQMGQQRHFSQGKLTTLQQKLRETGCPGNEVNSLTDVNEIQKYINLKVALKQRHELEDEKRTRYMGEKELIPVDKENGVLGKIGHLAMLNNPIEAKVLSWHLYGDMECIVTLTTEKAKELHSRYRGSKQLLPIEGIFRGNNMLNPQLPHHRIHQLRGYNPPGNPVCARTLLHFPNDENNCRAVFANLLGETIMIDTLSDGLEYRNQIVKFQNCPTIITRSGERLRQNGKFGGHGNKMPERLNYVFRICPNREIARIKAQLSILKELLEETRNRIDIDKKLQETQTKVAYELSEIEKEKAELRKEFDDCDAKISEIRLPGNKRSASTPIDVLRGADGDKRRR